MSFALWKCGAADFEQRDSINSSFLVAVTLQLLGAILLLVTNTQVFPYGGLGVILFWSRSQIWPDHITLISYVLGRMRK